MSFKNKVLAKYPERKKSEHSGDSYMIYEAGNRSPDAPFSQDVFDDFVAENEGEEADSDFSGTVNTNLSKRGTGNLPTEKEMAIPFGLTRGKEMPKFGGGYPLQRDWWEQALSSYPGVTSREDAIKNLAMASTLVKMVGDVLNVKEVEAQLNLVISQYIDGDQVTAANLTKVLPSGDQTTVSLDLFNEQMRDDLSVYLQNQKVDAEKADKLVQPLTFEQFIGMEDRRAIEALVKKLMPKELLKTQLLVCDFIKMKRIAETYFLED